MARKIKAALLVDADNLPVAQAEEALEKLAEVCNPVIKKAFGDFTKSAKNWSPEFMRKHGFTPEMHFAVSNFKNGADIAMCIAAMDIVYSKSVEAIVLFTSDSDFPRWRRVFERRGWKWWAWAMTKPAQFRAGRLMIL